MIRLVHVADLHLGVETHGRHDPATGLSTRLTDFLAALDQVVDYALTNDIHLFLFSGDAYKSKDPSQTHQREFAKRIQRLASGGVAVFLLAGNHDLPHAFGRATAVEIFHTISIPGVTVANRPAVRRVETRGGPLQVIAIPWPHRSHYLAREESIGLAAREVDQRLEAVVTHWVEQELQKLDASLPTILAAHVWVSTAKIGSERAMMVGQGPTFLHSTFARAPIDYGALGHVHGQQVLSLAPPLAYAGSLQAIDFSDEGQEKGFFTVELDPSRSPGGRAVSLRFQVLDTRPFLTIEVDAVSSQDPSGEILRAVSRHTLDGAIVRVRARVAAGQRRLLREAEIRQALKAAHHIASITVEEQGRERGRLPLVAGIAPKEALRRYLESKRPALSPEEIATLLQHGEQLIKATISAQEP